MCSLISCNCASGKASEASGSALLVRRNLHALWVHYLPSFDLQSHGPVTNPKTPLLERSTAAVQYSDNF